MMLGNERCWAGKCRLLGQWVAMHMLLMDGKRSMGFHAEEALGGKEPFGEGG